MGAKKRDGIQSKKKREAIPLFFLPFFGISHVWMRRGPFLRVIVKNEVLVALLLKLKLLCCV